MTTLAIGIEGEIGYIVLELIWFTIGPGRFTTMVGFYRLFIIVPYGGLVNDGCELSLTNVPDPCEISGPGRA